MSKTTKNEYERVVNNDELPIHDDSTSDITLHNQKLDWEGEASRYDLVRCSHRPLLITLTILISLSIMTFTPLILLQNQGRASLKTPIPSLPVETITFESVSDYSAPPTPQNNAMWMDLLGPGMGFAEVFNPSQYDLPPGSIKPHSPPNTQVYGISMYHQLHCLIMIREIYWAGIRGERNLNMNDTKLEEDLKHTNHCFDYLRQAVMCAGDMSLEGKGRPLPTGGDSVSGEGQRHECRSYDASRDWMDEHLPTI